MVIHLLVFGCLLIDFRNGLFELGDSNIPFPDEFLLVDKISIFVDATVSIINRRIALFLPKLI